MTDQTARRHCTHITAFSGIQRCYRSLTCACSGQGLWPSPATASTIHSPQALPRLTHITDSQPKPLLVTRQASDTCSNTASQQYQPQHSATQQASGQLKHAGYKDVQDTRTCRIQGHEGYKDVQDTRTCRIQGRAGYKDVQDTRTCRHHSSNHGGYRAFSAQH
jgi:hypothetical protein